MKEIDLTDEFLSYRIFIDKFRGNLAQVKRNQLIKFAFSLMDDDNDGLICPRDLQIFNMQFAGFCDVLM